MAIDFYYGSGSPYAWRVWLALEHKQLAYTLHVLSFASGDTRKPDFLAINPRHQVPAIVDAGFALHESNAICEYLDEAHPARPLLPKTPKERAIARRMVLEADHHLAAAGNLVARQVFFKPEAEWDAKVIDEGRTKLLEELAIWERAAANGWLVGDAPGLADHALYPFLATFPRYEKKKPDLALSTSLGPNLAAWMKRVEALPYLAKTTPPHWK